MANKYLDLTGLSYFWNKIKTWIQNYVKITTVESTSTITIGNTTLTPVLKDGDKVLSDNNFTDALKTKLDGIASGAEVNVNADWNASSGDAEILNKPTIPSDTGDLTNNAGFITMSDLPEGAVASTSTPLMDGTAAIGTDTGFARGDHVHPSDTTKANAAELSITNVSGNSDKKLITLKTGTSQEVLISHQDISGKADVSSTVSTITYDTTNKKFTKTINSSTTDIVTISTLKTDLSLVKGDVGLGNVTNDAQVKRTEMGAANGVATLNSSGKIPSEQLPSYVDDIIEAYARDGQTVLSSTWLATENASGTVITPETGVIYILMEASGEYSANTQFRWGSSTYVKINDGGISAITTSEVDTITDS